MQRNTSPFTPEPTGILVGYPTWLNRHRQNHALKKGYVITQAPTEVQFKGLGLFTEEEGGISFKGN